MSRKVNTIAGKTKPFSEIKRELTRAPAPIGEQPTQPEIDDATVDEVQQRTDAVVDATVAWHQDEGDWVKEGELLRNAVERLLELRSPPEGRKAEQDVQQTRNTQNDSSVGFKTKVYPS